MSRFIGKLQSVAKTSAIGNYDLKEQFGERYDDVWPTRDFFLVYSSVGMRGGSSVPPTMHTTVIPIIAKPNDFALMVASTNDDDRPTTPSGWTLIQSFSGDGNNVASYGKILSSGDIGTTVSPFTSSGATGENVTLFVFRNLGWVISPYFLAGGLQSQYTTGNPAAQTITPVTTKSLCVGIKYINGTPSASFSVNPFDKNELSYSHGSPSWALNVGYTYQLSTTNTVTFDTLDEGAAQLQCSYYISFNDIA